MSGKIVFSIIKEVKYRGISQKFTVLKIIIRVTFSDCGDKLRKEAVAIHFLRQNHAIAVHDNCSLANSTVMIVTDLPYLSEILHGEKITLSTNRESENGFDYFKMQVGI